MSTAAVGRSALGSQTASDQLQNPVDSRRTRPPTVGPTGSREWPASTLLFATSMRYPRLKYCVSAYHIYQVLKWTERKRVGVSAIHMQPIDRAPVLGGGTKVEIVVA